MDGFWFSSSHHFTLSLSPLPPFIALPNGCLMTMESPWTSWRIDYWLGPEIYTGATATRRAPEEINGTCNWVWSLGCVGVAASSVSPMQRSADGGLWEAWGGLWAIQGGSGGSGWGHSYALIAEMSGQCGKRWKTGGKIIDLNRS